MKKRTGVLILFLSALILCLHTAAGEKVQDVFGGLRSETLTEGFSVPVPEDTEKWRVEKKSGHQLFCRTKDREAPNSLYLDAYVFDPLSEFAESEEDAEKAYDAQHYETNPEYAQETVYVDGHAARICIFRGKADTGDYSVGILRYARNNRMLQVRLYSEPQNGTAWENLTRVTADDMRILAENISYDPTQATATAEDGSFTLTAKDGSILAGGGTLTIAATFKDPEKAGKSTRFHHFNWSVKDAESGKKPKGINIDKDGVMTAKRSIQNTMTVIAEAESPVFHTRAEIPVTVIPPMNGLTLEPKRILCYTGEQPPIAIRAIPEPKNVPAMGITWTAERPGIVELEADGESGTVLIRPLKAGDTVIAAKAPGGKTAKATVSVMTAVEDVDLSVTGGRAIPFGVVNLKATIKPENAGNKNLIWTLDVGPDVATVNKGKVTFSGRAVPGMVVTVFCRADGAPEPVTKTIQIEVIKNSR